MVKKDDEEVKPKVDTEVKTESGPSGGAPAVEVSEELLKATITTIISEGSLEELSTKKIRRIAEQKLQLETNALDAKKALLTQLTDEVMNSKRSEEAPAAPQAEAEAEEEEEQEEKPTTKKGKKRAAAAEEEAGPPKKLKELQSKMMTASEFERTAPQLSALLFGEHMLEGAPRTFSSGNRGWYAGKKMQIDVGKKKMWAQVGLNVTIVGSKEWDD